MKEKEILDLEKENYTTIHLHLVGIFWRAYQRSAFGFCKEIRSYKINIRTNKRQRTTVLFLGFPDSALQEILAVNEYTRVDDSHITLPMEYLSDDEQLFAFNANNYWSSTENNASNAWNVNFNNGNSNNNNKTNAYRVRCVRE